MYSPVDSGMKLCSKCKIVKKIDLFSNDKSKKDGKYTLCKSCKRENDNRYRVENYDRIRKRQIKWESENRDHCNQKARERYYKHRERRAELVAISVKKKPWLNAAREAKRRAAKLNATPIWADLDAIKNIYETCPHGFHVDHIIPLQGKTVCGLHVEYNLQHLSVSENISKSNLIGELL